MESRPSLEPSLDDVFWSRVGFGHKDIDCRSFVALCKESNLVDETFKDSTAEQVFQRSMPLSRRRLDFLRLKDALRRVAELKKEDEQAIHRKVIEAYARSCAPYLKRTGSLPVLGRTDSPKNDGHSRNRSSSGTKRHKNREKKREDKEKSIQLPSPTGATDKSLQLPSTSVTTPVHRLSPSASPSYNMGLPFSPAGQSQMSTTPGEASYCPSTPADGADMDVHNMGDLSPCQTPACLPTPSSDTSTTLMSIPNTPSCHYQSCPATPAHEGQDVESPSSCSTLQLPSCNPAAVMLQRPLAPALHPPEEVVETALAIHHAQHWEPAPEEGVYAYASTGGTPCSARQLPPVPSEAAPPSHESAESAAISPKSPPVPRLPLGVCTDDLDMPSLLSSRQPSHGPAAPAKTLKRPVRTGKGMTRVVSLPAPIDTGSEMAQLVSEASLGVNSPGRSPGRPSSGLFRRESPNAASASGKLDDFHGEKGRGTVEDTFKAFCGEHADMDSKSFVKLCKRCCLLDQKFTAHDARLVFSSAVPISHVRMDLQSFESALAHVAAKRGLDMGLVTRMVSWYEQPNGAESAPTSPSHEQAPMGLPESPLAKAVQRPPSASRSRAAMDGGERMRLPEKASALPVADIQRAQLEVYGGVRESVGNRDHHANSHSQHIVPLMPLQATLPIQAQLQMGHMMVGAF